VAGLSGSRQLGFLAFDEIFGSQDQEKRYAIMWALYQLQAEFKQILIISHVVEMKEEFPHLLEVSRKDGISSIRSIA